MSIVELNIPVIGVAQNLVPHPPQTQAVALRGATGTPPPSHHQRSAYPRRRRPTRSPNGQALPIADTSLQGSTSLAREKLKVTMR